MGKIKRYKNAVERFISSEGGQRFFNFAYSIGAAIVIWGALFKILHLPGGNTLLSIGMGTEVLMFILTAFDRPPREYNWEDVFPVLATKNPEDRPDFAIGAQAQPQPMFVTDTYNEPSPTPAAAPAQVSLAGATTMEGASEQFIDQMTGIAQQMAQLKATTEALNQVSQTLLDSYKAITENSENITASSTGYVDQMQALNRNISGLNTIYEIQLKSVSSQLDAIDRVNRGIKDICQMYENSAMQSSRYCEESEKMTMYMQQLNQVYEKMLRAMTVNMAVAGAPMGQPAAGQSQSNNA
ncbi:MAG: gliding motility protein GldL [Firmicutes bacterium]|nr:gliding motility protein GldL [Bacillota bacterium]MCM1401003.1 gliding motility protein GldL [Bacteroides sp.]MCM1476530.1 gliding motility protein GldL [Bacteroides sp.]